MLVLTRRASAERTKSVIFSTDQVDISIEAVHDFFGQPIDVIGLGSNQVTYKVQSNDDHGIECELEPLVFTTSDGFQITPAGDVCDDKTIIINVKPPVVDPSRVVQLDDTMAWAYYRLDANEENPYPSATLDFAVPETDHRMVSLSCVAESGQITLSLDFATAGEKSSQVVDFVSLIEQSPTLARMPIEWNEYDFGDGAFFVPMVTLHTSHPMFKTISKGVMLGINITGLAAAALPTQNMVDQLDAFLSICEVNDNFDSVEHQRPHSAYTFECDDQAELIATFYQDESEPELRVQKDSQIFKMNSVVSASGAKFTGDGALFWTKSDWALFNPNGDDQSDSNLDCQIKEK